MANTRSHGPSGWRQAVAAAAAGLLVSGAVMAADPPRAATPATPAVRATPAVPATAGDPATPALRAAPAMPASPSTQGRPGETPAQAYQRERAACLQGQTAQDRETCLKEAGAALGAARKGQLSDATPRESIAAERCSVHKDPDDQLACERMALGEGKTKGSVAEGAVVKEMVTRTVKPLSR